MLIHSLQCCYYSLAEPLPIIVTALLLTLCSITESEYIDYLMCNGCKPRHCDYAVVQVMTGMQAGCSILISYRRMNCLS